MNPYIPVLVMMGLAAVFAAVALLSKAVGPSQYNRTKYDSYECGIQPTPQPAGGGRFPVKYYITAMMFIIFDLEIVFMYPWAVSLGRLGSFALVNMLIFVAIIFVAYIYEWRRGGLDWE